MRTKLDATDSFAVFWQVFAVLFWGKVCSCVHRWVFSRVTHHTPGEPEIHVDAYVGSWGIKVECVPGSSAWRRTVLFQCENQLWRTHVCGSYNPSRFAGNSLLTPAGGVVVLRCFRRVQSSIATFPPTHELAFLCW